MVASSGKTGLGFVWEIVPGWELPASCSHVQPWTGHAEAGSATQCHQPSLCSEIEEQDAGVQGFLTPPGTDVLLATIQECGVGGTATLPSVWQGRTSCPHQLHCGGEVPVLSGLSQVTHGGGRQQSFSRPTAKSRSTGTLQQLNPDFLSQLPVPQP